jgi:CRP-like cAMP-binding protein
VDRASAERDRAALLSAGAAFGLLTVAEWASATALSVHAYVISGTLAVGFLGFRFLPAGLIGPFTAGLGDSARPQRVMAACAAARAALIAVAAVALAVGLPIAAPLTLIALDAMVATSYRPAQALLLPMIVRTPAELASATTRLSNVKNAGQVVGPLAGGLMAAAVRTQVTFACAAALFLLSALLAWRVRAGGSALGRQRAGSILRGSLAAVRSLAGDRDALVIVELGGVRSLVRGIWNASAVVAAISLLGMGRSGVGLLAAAAGAGTFATILAGARLLSGARLTRALGVGLALCALPLGLIGLISRSGAAVGLMVVWGGGMCLADAAGEALRARVVPARRVVRTVGVIEGLKLLLEGLGALVAVGLISLLGVRDMLIVLGAAVPVLAAAHIPVLAQIDVRASARLRLVELVRGIRIFGPLRVLALERLASALQPEEYAPGSGIVREGVVDEGALYVVDSGTVEVTTGGRHLRRLGPGASFGEIALLHDVPRTATVRALTDVTIWRLERDEVLSALTGRLQPPAARMTGTAPAGGVSATEALKRIGILGGAPASAIERLASTAERVEFEPGELVMKEGERGDRAYVVLEGTAEVSRSVGPYPAVGPGDVIGEIAVLHGVPRTATIRARTRLMLLAVDGEDLRAMAAGDVAV